ncbi:amino acid adenylation domain-containing protein [Salinactinospora qingdaonensis]|uniref:Phenyloxazoline synthase MbtB n=1 Tax=Salinactinospora qingdaonensis TaxID=702744 RepID=A0ABP7FBZ5_9ACTN
MQAGTHGSALTLEDMRAAVAAALDEDPAAIGDDDDLLRLGLDSIGVIRLASRWRHAGLPVTAAGLLERRTLAQWWELANGGETSADTAPAAETETGAELPEVDESAPFELTPMQHAYWVGRTDGQVLGGVGAHFYNEFDGHGVDPERLERAVRALIERHGMLRARFDAEGRQRITPHGAWPGLRVHDLRDLAEPELGQRLSSLRESLSHRRLDVHEGHVFDIQLSLLPQGATRVHVAIEMLVSDAHSFRILLADLAHLYGNPDEPLPPLEVSYPAYLAARRQGRDTERERARAYWQSRLAELPGAPELPLALAPEQVTSHRMTRRFTWLAAAERDRLAAMAREHGVTPSVVFLTAFAEVLAAWSAHHHFLLNLPLYDRELLHPDVWGLVGDFTNLLLLQVNAEGELSFAQRARHVQEQLQADVSHAAYSGVEVLRDLNRLTPEGPGGRGFAPVVFTSALSLGELFGQQAREAFGDPGWTMSQTPQVWLDHQVTEREDGLFLNWDAVEELFPEGVLDAMFDAYVELLNGLLTPESWQRAPKPQPQEQLATREALREADRPVSGETLHSRFFARAAEEPQRPALLWGDGATMGYGALAEAALRVAGALRERGVGPGDPIGVSLPKGPEQITAVLGVLAAGATYVPVGVDQPAQRLARIVARAGVRTVLTDPRWRAGTDWPEGVETLSPADAAAGEPLSAPVAVSDTDLAYVIFTSGSTGEPKGVEMPHRGAVNTIDDINERFGVGPEDRSLALSALDFDLSVYDLFGPLSAGGAVVLIDEDDRRSPERWAELAGRHAVTVINCVPTLLDRMLAATTDGEFCPRLRLVLLGGDWVGLDLPGRLAQRRPGCRFVALGGTTETAIHSTICEVVGEVPRQWRSIPYGRPLRNQRFRVVDPRGRDCPDWVPGELWIGGTGVATGYRNDPTLTAERFVHHNNHRWYRTGDLGRYWPDGTLEFLGRADHQVKIRGHRIEPGEIETALKDHPDITDAAVIATGTPTPHLHAAIVTTTPPPTDTLRDFLLTRLPAAMLPEHITPLDTLPLSPNGKIDRTTLTHTLTHHTPTTTHEPPHGDLEHHIATIWTDLLNTPTISRHDSFFTLGGDSLLATQMAERIRRRFGVELSLRQIFTEPDIAGVAALVAQQRDETGGDTIEEGVL